MSLRWWDGVVGDVFLLKLNVAVDLFYLFQDLKVQLNYNEKLLKDFSYEYLY